MKLLTSIMNSAGADAVRQRLEGLAAGLGRDKAAQSSGKRRISYRKLLEKRIKERRAGTFRRRSRVVRRDTVPYKYIDPDIVCRNVTIRTEEVIQNLFFRIKKLSRPVFEEKEHEAPKRYRRGVDAAKIFELPEAKRNFGKTESKYDSPFYLNPAAVFASKHKKLITTLSVLLIVAYAVTAGVTSIARLYTSKTVFIEDEQVAGNITITDRITTTTEMSQKVAYYLLVGVDDSKSLTDCIWITCYDIANSKVTVMQVPRDTYVGDESANGKFNAIYGNPKKVKFCETCQLMPDEDEIEDGVHTVCGTEITKIRESNISATIRAINEHFGLPIDHFVIFNFRGFARIVDTMGGVDIHLERGIHDATITLSAGDHHLDGWDAVNYMRHRKSYKEGDVARVSAQRLLVNALMQKALDMDVTDMLAVLTKCIGAFQTDMSMQEMTALATQARSVKVENLEFFTVPGYDYWKKPNPSYYICDEYETAEMINEKMLPYGLPDGGECSDETVNFPDVKGRKTTARTRPTDENGEVIKTTTTTTETTKTEKTTTTEAETTKKTTTTEAETTKKKTTTTEAETTRKTTTTEAETTKKTTTTEPTTTTTKTTTTTTTTAATTKATTAAPPPEPEEPEAPLPD